LIAKRWGIPNADKLTKATIQNRLYNLVMKAEENKEERGVEAFLRDIKTSNDSDKLKVSATVRDAIDKGVLIFDALDKSWKINYGDGTYRDVVSVSIPDMPQKEEVLILCLQDDNHMYTQLTKAMGRDDKVVTETIDIDKLRSTDDMSVLRNYARSLDISSFQKSREVIRQEILAKVLAKQDA